MPSATGIRAGAAFIELTVRDLNLRRGLMRAMAHLRAFGAGLQAVGGWAQAAGRRMAMLGAGIVAPMLAAAKSYANAGDQLAKMSRRTGITVEMLSELRYATQLSGTDIEQVEAGFKRFQRVLAEAAGGSKQATEALASLALSAGQLVGLKPDEQFRLIAERLSLIWGPANRAAAAMELFGRSGTMLLPLLEDLPQLTAEARRLGQVISTADAQAAEKLNDAFDRLWASIKMVVFQAGAALAPLISEWAAKITDAAGKVRKWIQENRGLVISALKIGLAIGAAGLALMAFGGILSAIGTAISVFATVAATAFGLILSPLGLVLTAIAGLGSYIAWATGYGGQALKWLGDRFADLRGTALTALQGVRDALAAGDITLAAQVLWTGLKVMWLKGTTALLGVWLEFSGKLASVWNNIVWGLRTAWSKFCSWITTGITRAINFVADAFDRLTVWLVKAFQPFDTWMQKRMARLWTSDQKELDRIEKRIDLLGKQDVQKLTVAVEQRSLARDLEEREMEKAAAADLGRISREMDDALAAGAEARAKRLADANAELVAAEEELKAVVGKAAAARRAAEEKAPEAAAAPELPALPMILPEMEEVSKAVRDTLDAVGTFSAFGLEQLAVGPTAVQERTAKASEETARNTKRLLDEARENGLAFD